MTNNVRREQYSIEVTYDEVSGHPRSLNIYLDGENHSPPDGRPAFVGFEAKGRPNQMWWMHKGLLHRENGPARIYINPDNGVHISEEYRVFGHSPISRDIPSTIKRDPDTGKITEELFWTGKSLLNYRLQPKP